MTHLRVSDNKRMLVHEDHSPFFYLGDTAWELFHRCDREQAQEYLADRARKRFSVIQAVVLAELDGLNTPNSYGHKPLIDNDPARPNEDYFRHVDWITETANRLGLFIGMLPTWGDKWNRRWGAGPEIFNAENARAYGHFIGRRYRDRNIIWIMGGDRPVDNEQQLGVVRAMAEGLRAGDDGAHLITFHPPGGDSSSRFVHCEKWPDFHMIQSGHVRDRDNYNLIDRDYRLLPVRPCVDAEPGYEDHPNSFNPERGWLDQADVRKSLYWALLAGACGYTYGNHNIWQMYDPAAGRKPITWAHTPWRQAIHHPGSGQVQYGRALIESRPQATREPAQWIIKSEIGSGGDPIRAARCRDGGYALVYLPSGQRVTIDMTKIGGGKAVAWWYNPRSGAAARVGEFDTTGNQEFQPPFDGVGRDWVLVLDDATRGYGEPGKASG
jgi:hypothetical protein